MPAQWFLDRRGMAAPSVRILLPVAAPRLCLAQGAITGLRIGRPAGHRFPSAFLREGRLTCYVRCVVYRVEVLILSVFGGRPWTPRIPTIPLLLRGTT